MSAKGIKIQPLFVQPTKFPVLLLCSQPLPLAPGKCWPVFVPIILIFPESPVGVIIQCVQLESEPGTCVSRGQAVPKSSMLGCCWVYLLTSINTVGKETVWMDGDGLLAMSYSRQHELCISFPSPHIRGVGNSLSSFLGCLLDKHLWKDGLKCVEMPGTNVS